MGQKWARDTITAHTRTSMVNEPTLRESLHRCCNQALLCIAVGVLGFGQVTRELPPLLLFLGAGGRDMSADVGQLLFYMQGVAAAKWLEHLSAHSLSSWLRINPDRSLGNPPAKPAPRASSF